MASGRRSLSQERLYWWSLRWAGPLGRLPVAWFGCTLVLVYVCSTLYHSLVRTRARHVLQIIDHSAIYLLIAGTYTPFALVSPRGRLGWLLFAIVWGLAILGILFKSVAIGRFAVASVVVYVGMGWLGVFVMRPLLHAVGWHGIVWIVLPWV